MSYNIIYVITVHTVYPEKYAHGFCFAVLCCGYTLTDFPISIRLTSLALWQSNDCPSASKVILMNMDKYFMWIHYERLHNLNKAKHNKTVCIFLGIYCTTMLVHRVCRSGASLSPLPDMCATHVVHLYRITTPTRRNPLKADLCCPGNIDKRLELCNTIQDILGGIFHRTPP